MSMIGNFRRVTPGELAALQRDASNIIGFVYPEDEDPEVSDRELDIDKSWQVIHYLLTGDPWEGEAPLVNAIMGGEVLGTEDVGYGPPRFITPAEVQAVAFALGTISSEELGARMDVKKLVEEDIYPAIWEEDAEDLLDYILHHYQLLVEFYQNAATAGDAMLLYLN